MEMEEEEENPHVNPNKRLRAPSPSLPPSYLASKGKAKMEESALGTDGDGEDPAAGAEGRTCGICLTEEGRSIRGTIDSCNHYFCFVCIMEWAKIESRCPLCKRRFGSIRRPPVPGVFFGEKVVHVPARDQVHQLFGNATGSSDPYADTICSVCHNSTDEHLLLLCDLCDSATHTYCVGLGFTVPEGDWYCHDCMILRDEHTKMQDDGHSSNEHCNRISRTMVEDTSSVSMVEDASSVSIFEIIRDETSSNSFCRSRVKVIGRGTNDGRTMPGTGIAERKSQDKAAAARSSQSNALYSDERPSRSTPIREFVSSFPKAKVTEIGARTLGQCRNVHLRIQILRENWCSLRNGFLDFKSSLACGTNNSRKHNNRDVSSRISRPQDYQSSTDNEEAASGSRVSSEMSSYTNSHDVSKAWKMLEIAKSRQRAPAGAKSSHQSPKLCGKKSVWENKVLEHKVSQGISEHKSPGGPVRRRLPRVKTHENRLLGGIESEKCVNLNPFVAQEKCNLQNSEKQRPCKLAMGETGHYDKGSKSNCEVLPGKVGEGSIDGIYHVSRSLKQKDVPPCSGPSNCLQVGNFDPSAGKKEAVECVGSKKLPSNVNSVLNKNVDESSTRACDSAKSEIQSLVKLNLKLQCKGSHLGADKFKEVARVATHTILAACGLDHSKLKSRPVPSSICRHDDQVKLLRRANLMPDSCRECFYSFVKDVVDSVVSEKTSVSSSKDVVGSVAVEKTSVSNSN